MKKTFLNIFCLLMLLIGGMSTANAIPAISLGYDFESLRLVPGDTYVVNINLTNAFSVKTAQADVVLPEGLEIVESDVENGYFELTSRVVRGLDVKANMLNDSTCRFMLIPSGRVAIEAGAGNILSFTVKATAELAPVSELKLVNATLSTLDNVEYTMPDYVAEVKNAAILPELILSIADINAEAGVATPIEVALKNSAAVSAMQFDLQVPEGVTIDTEKFDYSDRLQQSHLVTVVDLGEGKYRVVINSSSNGKLRGAEGTVITLYLTAAKGMESAITVSKQVYSNPEGQKFSGDLVIFDVPLSVKALFGDLDNDGDVNIGDYTIVANYILAGENPAEADLNNDGGVDVGDLTAMANLILYGEQDAASAKPRNATDPTAFENLIYIKDATAEAGQEIEIPVYMKNSVGMTGFQFDIVMPEGLSVAMEDDYYLIDLSTERTTARNTNTFDSAKQKDGSVRVLAGSTKSKTIEGNDGEVAIITANVAAGLADGEYKVALKNIIMSDATGKTYKVETSEATITVASATGISNVNTTVAKNGKFNQNGTLVIVNNGKTFNAAGALLK